MKTYKNVAVWDAEHTVAEMCDVQTENGKFVSIVPAGTIKAGCAYECRGKMAMLPGFVNAHGHAPMTLLRGLGEEMPLMEWLEKRMWPIENRLGKAQMKLGTQLAMLEMISTGTTCYAEQYFDMDEIPQAVLDSGMRAGLSRGLTNASERDRLVENIELFRQWHGAKGQVNVQFGPHALYTVDFEYLSKVAETAREYGAGVQMHWLETKGEWAMCDCKDKMTPEEYLAKSGLADVANLTLAHGVWIDESAMDFYANDNITIVHCPKSNLKLGSGTANVPSLFAHGVSVALGTDGAASNNRLDMWDEMRFAALLNKGVRNDPTLMTAREVLKMATVSGAKALGFDRLGLIKEGWSADFMLVDLDQPQYVGWNCSSLAEYLVYAGSSADVRETVAAGEPLYQDGEFLTLDRQKIVSAAAAARDKLTK